MKIIWKTNIPLPKAADAFWFSKSYGGGWLVGLSEDLRCQPEIELSICFLQNGISGIQEKTVDNITYIAVPQKILNSCIYNADLEGYFKAIADKVRPDVIHVFGTEFPHTLSMVKACSADYNTVISIQGLVSIIAKHYYAGLPYSVLKKKTFRDWIRGGLIQNRRNFEKSGVFEVKALQKVRHIIGRTTWDRACIKQINPEAKYYHCNETLRSEFYKHQWRIDSCEKHSIFLSQAGYPIKGLHFMLEALPEIIRRYPKTRLYIAGNNIIRCSNLKEKLKMTAYGKYNRRLIHELGDEHVVFTGPLDEKAMCERMCKSHVFVCPSSIENSPNSLGEAMLLGMPCVASDVGGVSDMIIHRSEGFLYPYDASYMLSHYVCDIFEDDKLADKLGSKAQRHARKTHDRKRNLNDLLSIYNNIKRV